MEMPFRITSDDSQSKSSDQKQTTNGVNERKKVAGCFKRFLAWDGSLMVLSAVGVVIGFALGITLHFTGASDTALLFIGLPGELYLRMLTAVILPLVIGSVITGSAGLRPKENGRVGVLSLGYIVVTNALGSVFGTLGAIIFQPGKSVEVLDDRDTTLSTGNLQTPDLFADLFRNLVPANIVSAAIEKTVTRYAAVEHGDLLNATLTYKRHLGSASGTNFLGLVVVCAVLGMAAAKVGRPAEPLIVVSRAISEVSIQITKWLFLLTPLGIASLIAKATASAPDIETTFRGLGMYVLAYTSAGCAYFLVILGLFCFLVLRKNPISVFRCYLRPTIIGVSVPSSLATLPELVLCWEKHDDVDDRVSGFVAAMAVNINRDGSALFVACTAMYMAQVATGTVSAGAVTVCIVLTAVGSLAIPGVPSSSMVTVLMIVTSLHVPPVNIGILMALEWFSDRFRTFLNIESHILCGLFTWKFCRGHLEDTSTAPSAMDVCSNGNSQKSVGIELEEDPLLENHSLHNTQESMTVGL